MAQTGPGGILIDYSIIGVIVFMVMAALGEMTSFAPMSRKYTRREYLWLFGDGLDVLKQSLGGFGGYATRFVDPALGFATGYAYFFKYLLATPNQLSALALIIEVSIPLFIWFLCTGYSHSHFLSVLDWGQGQSGSMDHHRIDSDLGNQLYQRQSLWGVRILVIIRQNYSDDGCYHSSVGFGTWWWS